MGLTPTPSPCKTPPPTLREGSKRPELGLDLGSESAGPCRFVSWGFVLGHLGASWNLSCQDSLKKRISMVCYDFLAPLGGLLGLTPTPSPGKAPASDAPGRFSEARIRLGFGFGGCRALQIRFLGLSFGTSWGLLGPILPR